MTGTTTETPVIVAPMDYISMGLTLAALASSLSSAFLGARMEDAHLLSCFQWHRASSRLYHTSTVTEED